jgi:hypothetical protein
MQPYYAMKVWHPTLSPGMAKHKLPNVKALLSIASVVASAACSLHGVASSNDAGRPSVPSPTQTTSTSNQRSQQAHPIDTHWPNKYTFAATSLATTVAGADLKAEYPRIRSARDPKLKAFNRWIRTKVLDYVARFKHVSRINNRDGHWIEMGLDLSYEIFYSDETLISLRLTHSLMEAGQMHPIDYYETINYDLRRRRQLGIRDVFKRGYLKVFSSYSRKRLSETYEIPNQDWFEKGTAPKASNFSDWNIVPDGILISFEDYQVSSHSFGQPQLIVPYSELREVMLRKRVTQSVAKP